MRYLIVTGTELGNSKLAIGRLGDNKVFEKLFLKKEYIDRFIRQVAVHILMLIKLVV